MSLERQTLPSPRAERRGPAPRRERASRGRVAWTRLVPLVALGLLALGGATPSPAETTPREAVDVVFVLDNSGSMKTNDPQRLTRRAVADFADALAAETTLDGRIGLVLFDGHTRLVQRLTPAVDLAATRRLDGALDALDFSGQRTDSPAAIERALYELREHGRAQARQAIVFLSDGRIDTGDPRRDAELARWMREDLATESAAAGVRIFGIAFTEDADYQLMQALARRTEARYYRAFAPAELSGVVDDVLAKLAARRNEGLAMPAPATATPGAKASADGVSSRATPPNVSAAPLPAPEAQDPGSRLLGWLPLLLLLVGSGLWLGARRVAQGRSDAAFAPPAAQLLDLGGQAGEAGRSFALASDRTRIGRDPHNDVVLEDDTISSEHALIEYRDGSYWLQDLRSTNGTRLAERRLAPDERAALKGGDHVRFADVDLMFVMRGYVPGGATAYLSSSTLPPADWSVLAESTDAPGDPGVAARESSPARSGETGASDATRREIVFAVQRERLDPAWVANLDEALGSPVEESPSSRPTPDVPEDTFAREALAHADAVLAEIARAEESATGAPGPVDAVDEATGPAPDEAERDAASAVQAAVEAEESTGPSAVEAAAEESTEPSLPEEASAGEAPSVRTFDPDATARIPLVHATSGAKMETSRVRAVGSETPDTVDAEDEVTLPQIEALPSHDALGRCLAYHLARVAELSPAFEEFVDRAFTQELREALPVAACDLIAAARASGRVEQREYTHDRVRFLICGLDGPMPTARDAFVRSFGGFTRLLTEQLEADSFRRQRCRILAVLSFGAASGADDEPWVSLSIVPDEGQDPRIDLLSYELLTDVERREIEPTLDAEISQSGLA